MTHDFIDTYVLFGFIFGMLVIILAVCVDRYKSLRWSSMLNAEYLSRVASQAASFRTFEYKKPQPLAEFRWEVETVHVAGANRSRKRVLRDRFDRIVARHYEQIVVVDLVEALPRVKTPLLLPPATV